MADEKTAPKKRTRRGFPWTGIAKSIKAVGRNQDEAEQIAWNLWFETACPETYELVKEHPDALKELYEQLSGKLVDDGEEEEASDKPESTE